MFGVCVHRIGEFQRITAEQHCHDWKHTRVFYRISVDMNTVLPIGLALVPELARRQVMAVQPSVLSRHRSCCLEVQYLRPTRFPRRRVFRTLPLQGSPEMFEIAH